jgi:hypothetical protein
MASDIQKRIDLLSGRIKGLRYAVQLDDFRLAQRLRMGLAAYLRHLDGPLRDEVTRLFEITGLWLRNVEDRHQNKRQAQQQIRRIIPRLNSRARRQFDPGPRTQSLGHRAPAADRGELSPSPLRRRG